MWEKTGVHIFISYKFVLHFMTRTVRDTRRTILSNCFCEYKAFAATEHVDYVILVLEPRHDVI